jgi:hypothetical protein
MLHSTVSVRCSIHVRAYHTQLAPCFPQVSKGPMVPTFQNTMPHLSLAHPPPQGGCEGRPTLTEALPSHIDFLSWQFLFTSYMW